ncbi:MAG: ankyrin repeat domain-containing protein [Opitutae bacterium]|jgi:ankyrin repeat protein|nr:ankyrin repeat domain-containing protein [Opitutae bacterium]MBT5310798.1 ankyrin repeat domain-containing protein [Verrucomicrobiota bacterium]MBT7028904.1 ankyrin repeat domain-containing protein [Verrucomicrobiota bacterium]
MRIAHEMKLFLPSVSSLILLATSALASPIHDAAEGGDAGAVGTWLKTGADVNAKDETGRTPLHLAAGGCWRCWGHKEVAELLIAKGAKVNAKDDTGRTPLQVASLWGDREVAELLIANGADVNATNDQGEASMHYAARSGHIKIAERLIASFANVNAKVLAGSYKGMTPLDLANRYDQAEVAGLIDKHGGKTGTELALIPRLAYSRNQLAIVAKVGLKFSVLFSSDLKRWQVLDTVTIDESPHVYVDETAVKEPARFYLLQLVE